jgi:aminoglycoside phosphotransferase (APT) family kinase protein
MHADELPTDAGLVRRLLATQFPDWAELPVARVPSSGTDNALYRLGDELVVRLPRIGWAVGGVDREVEWLPRLARHLPLEVPAPVAKGVPGEGYPWPWAVYRWLEGENAVLGALADADGLARELGRFVRALRAIDRTGAPPAGRAKPLAERDAETRAALADLRGLIDTGPPAAAWEEALGAPAWDGEPTWIHGDLMPGNLLLREDRLAAVIDFAGVGLGDPAVDLIVAWNLLPAGARDVYRGELDVDDTTWARGRGWALSVALIQLPYYWETNRALAGNARHVLRELLGR